MNSTESVFPLKNIKILNLFLKLFHSLFFSQLSRRSVWEEITWQRLLLKALCYKYHDVVHQLISRAQESKAESKTSVIDGGVEIGSFKTLKYHIRWTTS